MLEKCPADSFFPALAGLHAGTFLCLELLGSGSRAAHYVLEAMKGVLMYFGSPWGVWLALKIHPLPIPSLAIDFTLLVHSFHVYELLEFLKFEAGLRILWILFVVRNPGHICH